jgi:hypothetical protein
VRSLGILFGNRHNTAHRLLFLLNAGDEALQFSAPAVPSIASWVCRFDTARTDVEVRTLDFSHYYPLAANSAVLLEC